MISLISLSVKDLNTNNIVPLLLDWGLKLLILSPLFWIWRLWFPSRTSNIDPSDHITVFHIAKVEFHRTSELRRQQRQFTVTSPLQRKLITGSCGLHDELIMIHLDGILTVAAGFLDELNIKCLILRFAWFSEREWWMTGHEKRDYSGRLHCIHIAGEQR